MKFAVFVILSCVCVLSYAAQKDTIWGNVFHNVRQIGSDTVQESSTMWAVNKQILSFSAVRNTFDILKIFTLHLFRILLSLWKTCNFHENSINKSSNHRIIWYQSLTQWSRQTQTPLELKKKTIKLIQKFESTGSNASGDCRHQAHWLQVASP